MVMCTCLSPSIHDSAPRTGKYLVPILIYQIENFIILYDPPNGCNSGHEFALCLHTQVRTKNGISGE